MKHSFLNRFFHRFFQTKLAMKIWICLTALVFGLLLLSGAALELFFRQYVEEDSLKVSLRNTEHAAESFLAEYTSMIERFVTLSASAGFYDILSAIESQSSDEYLALRTELPSYLSRYEDTSPLINTAMIATPDNRFFYSYNYKLKQEALPYTLGYDLSEAGSITMLPSAESPFRGQSEVIPLVFLLKTEQVGSGSMVLLADGLADCRFILYLFLNTGQVQSYLDLFYNNADSGSLLFLADANGIPISLPADEDGSGRNAAKSGQNIADSGLDSPGSQKGEAQFKRIAAKFGESAPEAVQTCIAQLAGNGEYCRKLNDYYVSIRPVPLAGLFLVNIISQNELLSPIRQFDVVLLYMAIAILLSVPILIILLTRFVTKPLRLLVSSVKAIEEDTYEGLPAISADDEIGQLGRSIDSMYGTIKRQIQTIKEEEREKFRMEIRLRTEQINPHFLYNALECINMEVYNRHNEEASAMLASLGGYLRISLSYGKNQLTIAQETELLKAYVAIMNYRFRQEIRLSFQIGEGLADMLLLKSILQPLVENSIRHGFSIDMTNNFPNTPAIDVAIRRGDAEHMEQDELILSVMDNGAGIDIKRAELIMNGEGKDSDGGLHVGLNNIYHRLNTFYGGIQIEFRSIPYFQNEVKIRIPYQKFSEAQEQAG